MKILSNTKIDFISKRYVYFLISGVMILVGLVSLIVKGGPQLGIDFQGGYLFQIGLSQAVEMETLRRIIGEVITSFEIQSIVDQNEVIIRVKKEARTTEEIIEALEEKFFSSLPDLKISWNRVEYVGPVIGRHLFKQALSAIVFSLLGIVLYVAFRFKSIIWGTAGVLALAHDVFVVFGFLSILNREITLTVVAALLTLAGYSINDTIVIFDRIREKMRMMRPKDDLAFIVNASINETLPRTIITSLTLFFVVVALYFFGGSVLNDFALALLLGVIVGTYSSVCVAAPIVYEWKVNKELKTKKHYAENKKV